MPDTIVPHTSIKTEEGSIHYVFPIKFVEKLATFGLCGVRISIFRVVKKIENKLFKGYFDFKKTKKI